MRAIGSDGGFRLFTGGEVCFSATVCLDEISTIGHRKTDHIICSRSILHHCFTIGKRCYILKKMSFVVFLLRQIE